VVRAASVAFGTSAGKKDAVIFGRIDFGGFIAVELIDVAMVMPSKRGKAPAIAQLFEQVAGRLDILFATARTPICRTRSSGSCQGCIDIRGAIRAANHMAARNPMRWLGERKREAAFLFFRFHPGGKTVLRAASRYIDLNRPEPQAASNIRGRPHRIRAAASPRLGFDCVGEDETIER